MNSAIAYNTNIGLIAEPVPLGIMSGFATNNPSYLFNSWHLFATSVRCMLSIKGNPKLYSTACIPYAILKLRLGCYYLLSYIILYIETTNELKSCLSLGGVPLRGSPSSKRGSG
jgi:hypothetical protein